MSSNKPIGIFDSGVGGTSIWREIHHLLPNEKTIYLADSKNAPYGEKPRDEIVALSTKNVEKLLALDCKIIVVACNTATTNAIEDLRQKYRIPFVGIEPAIKPAALKSRSKKIGILATKGTLSSELFYSTAELHSKGTEITEVVGTGLVELIESGQKDSQEMELLLKNLLTPFIENNIDFLVLGCSHYPYIIPVIKKLLPPHVTIIDSGEAVAKQTKNLLKDNNILSEENRGSCIFLTNKNPEILKGFVNSEAATHEVSYLDF
ncbi:MAG TPA: glutamate racemase [Salinimicrobium sp.]|nr:glutamate racemase [Salinimicrobium sp.]